VDVGEQIFPAPDKELVGEVLDHRGAWLDLAPRLGAAVEAVPESDKA